MRYLSAIISAFIGVIGCFYVKWGFANRVKLDRDAFFMASVGFFLICFSVLIGLFVAILNQVRRINNKDI